MAEPREERRRERAQATRKVMAKRRARAIRRRWIGGGEFDPVSGAVAATRKREKRERRQCYAFNSEGKTGGVTSSCLSSAT
jgi:hypothetical protein